MLYSDANAKIHVYWWVRKGRKFLLSVGVMDWLLYSLSEDLLPSSRYNMLQITFSFRRPCILLGKYIGFFSLSISKIYYTTFYDSSGVQITINKKKMKWWKNPLLKFYTSSTYSRAPLWIGHRVVILISQFWLAGELEAGISAQRI